MSCISLVLEKKINLVFIISWQDSIQGFGDGNKQKIFIMDKLRFSFSVILQPIKSWQCLSEAELICEKVLFPSDCIFLGQQAPQNIIV